MNVIPAHGRNYKTSEEVTDAWNSGKDFLVVDEGHAQHGRCVNRLTVLPGISITVEFRKRRESISLSILGDKSCQPQPALC